MRRSLKSFGIIVPCALGVLGLLVGGSSLWQQNTGFNPAIAFITQSLRYESYDEVLELNFDKMATCGDGIVAVLEQCETNEQCIAGSTCSDCLCQLNPNGGWNSMPNSNPNGGFNSSVSNNNGFVDLSLHKELLGISRSSIYRYRVTVSNGGNANALSFTVKDYVPSNAFLLYASDGALIKNNTVTRSVDALQARESRTFIVELKKMARGTMVNRAEICDYEEAGEFLDPDSDPCTMGSEGLPMQDDEVAVDS